MTTGANGSLTCAGTTALRGREAILRIRLSTAFCCRNTTTLPKALTGPIKNIFDGSTLGLTEAPHLHKRGAYYYLITAEGGTGYNHAVTHARSKSLWGPYEIHPSVHPLTAKDTPATPLPRVGHGQFVDVDDDRVVHTFLCSQTLERELFAVRTRDRHYVFAVERRGLAGR